jgi:peptide/nickel transport system permease protein
MSGPLATFFRNPGAVAGLIVLLIVTLTALCAPFLVPGDPWAMVGQPYEPPFGADHWLGTDSLGRDILNGIIYGARVSLLIGIVSAAVALTVGVVAGAIAGFFGGKIDSAIMGLTEVFQVIPGFILAILIVAIFDPNIYSIVVAITVIAWPAVARLVRGEALAFRQREFIQAAIVVGQPWYRILFKELLPNALSPIIVTSTIMVGTAILQESALSFLGLGDPQLISWGYMIGQGRNVIRQAWWLTVFPGLALVIVILALNVVSEGLNDALNPRLERRR